MDAASDKKGEDMGSPFYSRVDSEDQGVGRMTELVCTLLLPHNSFFLTNTIQGI